MNRTAFFFALIFTFVGYTILPAQDLKAIVDETLVAIPPGDGQAAMIIGISQKGKTQYFTFGSQEGLGKKAVDEHQLFELGTATGVFTSTLMLLEAQKGAFLPEDRVVNYLPEGMTLPLFKKYNCMDIPISGRLPGQRFQGISTASICRPAEGSPFCISFCDLASHTSGLSDIKGTYQFNPLREKAYSTTKPKYLSVDKVMNKINKGMLSFQPGEKFRYTSLDLAVLGIALENISGHTYEDMLELNIFGPLGMDASKTILSVDERKNMTKGMSAEGKPAPLLRLEALQATGGLKSSAKDLMIFLNAHLNTDIPELASAFEQSTTIRVDLPEKLHGKALWMGYGWFISPTGTYHNQQLVWTAGATPGYQSFLGFEKESQIAVVVLTADQSDAQRIGKQLLERLIPPADLIGRP